jgi:hypothetical protein
MAWRTVDQVSLQVKLMWRGVEVSEQSLYPQPIVRAKFKLLGGDKSTVLLAAKIDMPAGAGNYPPGKTFFIVPPFRPTDVSSPDGLRWRGACHVAKGDDGTPRKHVVYAGFVQAEEDDPLDEIGFVVWVPKGRSAKCDKVTVDYPWRWRKNDRIHFSVMYERE